MSIESTMKEEIRFGGEIRVLKTTLTTMSGLKVDLSSMWVSIELYESMFSNVLTGAITIEDRNNLIRNAPLIGREKIELVYKTPTTNEIRKKFFVYDMSVSQRVPGKEQMIITLQFASVQYILDHSTKISRSYKNKRWSDAVQSIFKDYLESNENESGLVVQRDTLPRTSFILPYWSPFQAINWISTKCENYGNCDYVFFEGMDNFYFASLSYFKKKKTTPIYYSYTMDLEDKGADKDMNNVLRRIISYTIENNGNNKSEMEIEGVFSSETVVHDVTSKTITEKTFSYSTDFNRVPRLSENPIAPMSYASTVRSANKLNFAQNSVLMHDRIRQQYDPFHSQKRRSQLLRNNAKVLNLEVFGDTRRRVGEILKVEILSPEYLPEKKMEVFDGTISGLFLLTSIGHQINKIDGHHMTLEVMSDSYEEPIPDEVSA